jgi:hypothetical protein
MGLSGELDFSNWRQGWKIRRRQNLIAEHHHLQCGPLVLFLANTAPADDASIPLISNVLAMSFTSGAQLLQLECAPHIARDAEDNCNGKVSDLS